MSKRSQAALEYLLTYGWAILIIIIVGASLYALGVFSPGTWTGKRQTGFVQFQIHDWKWESRDGDHPGRLTIVFGNRLGKTLEVTNILATYKDDECDFSLADFDLGSGTRVEKYGNCGGAWGNVTTRTSYSINVDIEYIDPDSGLSHIDVGTLFGIAEE